MPTPKSHEETIGALRLLPPELINFLSSTDVVNAIEDIEIYYDLEPEMTSRLLNAIAWYTTGFINASELGLELAKIAPQGKFAEFRSDVIKKIFMPFATQLHEHGLNFEAILSTAVAPSAAPQPAPVSPMQEASSPPTPAKPSPEPVVISATATASAPAPIVIQAPVASAKQEASSTASPPLAAKPPATVNQKSVVSSQLSVVSSQAPKPSPVVSTATPAAIPSKPATTQLPPTAAPKITIAGHQPGVPAAPIQEEASQKIQPEITPKAIRYTPAPVIREVPKVISPTDGKKPQEPQQQIAPQQVPPQQSKPQSPVIDLSTFQITQNTSPSPASQNKAQPPASSMPPGTPSAQPKAKGNMIDLKGFL